MGTPLVGYTDGGEHMNQGWAWDRLDKAAAPIGIHVSWVWDR